MEEERYVRDVMRLANNVYAETQNADKAVAAAERAFRRFTQDAQEALNERAREAFFRQRLRLVRVNVLRQLKTLTCDPRGLDILCMEYEKGILGTFQLRSGTVLGEATAQQLADDISHSRAEGHGCFKRAAFLERIKTRLTGNQKVKSAWSEEEVGKALRKIEMTEGHTVDVA